MVATASSRLVVARLYFGMIVALGAACTSFRGADVGPTGGGSDASASADGAIDDGASADDAGVEACEGKDMTRDPRHCGACSRDCSFGACVDGRCEPWLVATAGGVVTGLDVDTAGEHLYFGVGEEVWRVKTDGASLEKVATLPVGASVLDITRWRSGMLVCSSQGIHEILPGGAPTKTFSSVTSCSAIVADGTTLWATSLTSIVEIAGAAAVVTFHPAPLFPNQPSASIDVQGGHLYFQTDGSGVRRVSKSAIDAGSSRVGTSSLDRPQGLAMTDEYAYVTAFSPRALSRITLDGASSTELVPLSDAGFTYRQGLARSPVGKTLYYAVGTRVMGYVPPP
jgi:hypothetical protein